MVSKGVCTLFSNISLTLIFMLHFVDGHFCLGKGNLGQSFLAPAPVAKLKLTVLLLLALAAIRLILSEMRSLEIWYPTELHRT